MAARRWGYFPNVTGNCTHQHFEIVDIPPTPKDSEGTLSERTSVSSFKEGKSQHSEPSHVTPYSLSQEYFGLENQFIQRDVQVPSTSGGLKFYAPQGCVSSGNIVMRLSTDAQKKTLDFNSRNLRAVKEQNSVVSTQRLSSPTPSTISTIVDTEFNAHNQQKMRKWFGKHIPGRQSPISFKANQQCTSCGTAFPEQAPVLENVDERLKIKIEHHRNTTDPTTGEKSNKEKQFRRRISKIMKFPSTKLGSITQPTVERKSMISFKSSDEIIFDECDYVRKTKARRPVETFAPLPLSEDEYDSSESSVATRSLASTDESGFVLRKEFQSTDNLRYMNKHRERCESLLKEAERMRTEYRPTNFDHEETCPKRTFYTPGTVLPVPTAYCVSNAPINSLIKNSVELLSERLNNKVKDSLSLRDTACEARTCKTQVNMESNESLHPHIPMMTAHQPKIIVDECTTPFVTQSTEEVYQEVRPSDVCDRTKINLLRRRLADWKTKTSKSQECTTQKVTKKKRTESKRCLKTTAQNRQEEKEQLKSKEFLKSREYEKQNSESAEDDECDTKREKRGVLRRVIPNWLRFFGSKKTQEQCSYVEKTAGKEVPLDRRSISNVGRSPQKAHKCKC